MEPVSKKLQQILLGQKLCTARDLRRCRKRVRQLSGDLPAFDSVWLDALVRAQRLTSYQAQAVESGEADRLRLGPCVVLERLGGCRSETFLARDVASWSLLVAKRVTVATEVKLETLKRLQTLIQQARQVDHPAVVLPHACSELSVSPMPKRRSGEPSGPSWLASRVELAVASR